MTQPKAKGPGECTVIDKQVLSQALFRGVVYNERGESADVVYIGGVAHYAIPDDGFLRHVEAYKIDNTVIDHLQSQVSSMKDQVVQSMLQLLGKKDIFTKAALDASVRNLGQQIRESNPEQWLPWLRLFGFRVVVDVHGDVIDIIYPQQPGEDE